MYRTVYQEALKLLSHVSGNQNEEMLLRECGREVKSRVDNIIISQYPFNYGVHHRND